MKKFKKLFSRFSLVALTIVFMFVGNVMLVAGLIWLFYVWLVELFPPMAPWLQLAFGVFSWFVTFATALHAANRDMVPETKLPWILCIVGLNLFGVAIYAVFSSHRPTKRIHRAYLEMRALAAPYEERRFTVAQTQERLGRWADVSEALYTANPSAVLHSGTKTEFFPVGEAFAARLLADLKGARRYIFMEYFIIGRGAFWQSVLDVLVQKVREGVEVRFVYDDIGCMGKVHFRYHKTLQKLGIKCVKFNPFVPVITNVHNNRDHRKVTVIDGTIAYTGGINLSDEYVNLEHPFGHWKDTAVRLEGEGVRGFILMFLKLYNLSRREDKDFSVYIPQTYEAFEGEGYVQPYGDGPRPMYGRHLGEDVYINILNGAKEYVWIHTPYLIIDYRMREALLQAAARGVDVRLVTPHIPDKKLAFSLTRSNYAALMKGGVKIYEYTPGFIHAKGFLADDAVGVVGTINLDYRSLLFHFEDAVFMYGTAALKQMKEDMERTFEVSALQTEEDAKKSVVWRGLCELAKLFAPLF